MKAVMYNLILIEQVMFIYLYIYIYMCTITCQVAVRIWLKIGRYDIQVSESNLGYVPFVHTPLFKWSN